MNSSKNINCPTNTKENGILTEPLFSKEKLEEDIDEFPQTKVKPNSNILGKKTMGGVSCFKSNKETKTFDFQDSFPYGHF